MAIRAVAFFLAAVMLLASAGCCTAKKNAACVQSVSNDTCSTCNPLVKADHWMQKNLW